MNEIFDECVRLPIVWAKYCHMSNKEINIWIFVIIEPLVFVVMLIIIIRQFLKIRRLKGVTNQ